MKFELSTPPAGSCSALRDHFTYVWVTPQSVLTLRFATVKDRIWFNISETVPGVFFWRYLPKGLASYQHDSGIREMDGYASDRIWQACGL